MFIYTYITFGRILYVYVIRFIIIRKFQYLRKILEAISIIIFNINKNKRLKILIERERRKG